MTKLKNELDIIEQLNKASSVRGVVLAAVDIFENTLNQLIQRVFRKDDHAVKYAVEPLLNSAGPLSDLMVRLKLLYGLGIISQDVYQDIEQLISLREQLNNDGREFSFTSPETLGPIKNLHAIKKMGIAQLDAPVPDKDEDINFYNMYMARQEQVIRSAFGLAVASMCTELNQDTPLL
jgi:mannitol operon repressor